MNKDVKASLTIWKVLFSLGRLWVTSSVLSMLRPRRKGMEHVLQILVWKIISHKPSFRAEANKQLKHQYALKMWDQYYAAIAWSTWPISDNTESFTQFCDHLEMTFSSHSRLEKLAPIYQLLRSPHLRSLRSQGNQDYQNIPDSDKLNRPAGIMN